MRLILTAAVWLTLWPGLALAATDRDCAAPSAGGDGWPIVEAAKAGLDPKVLCSIAPTLQRLENAAPHAIVIVRHGALIYEHDFPEGREYVPGEVVGGIDRTADTVQDVHSITKSVTALLAGILVDREP